MAVPLVFPLLSPLPLPRPCVPASQDEILPHWAFLDHDQNGRVTKVSRR